ncbi:nudix hydrolase 2-like [Mangifera indica]|uniref:nudix hydrolase 2-like n=1 Tax=Mangifera indica TaxID=29780 RepID=UPI001CFBA3FD|nr:nudix hydrolase 2-like [Mangifera indica]
MQRVFRTSKLLHFSFANRCSLPSSSPLISNATCVSKTPSLSSWFTCSKAPQGRIPFLTGNMSSSTSSFEKPTVLENEVQHVELLNAVDDLYGGVTVDMEKPMDSKLFASALKSSLSYWRQRGKKGVWIKLPSEFANLVEPAVQQGFRYHHAEPDYLMLVHWIPETPDTLPVNASHRVGVGAFVINHKREVLVVQESSGQFRGKGVWKLPTGVVNEGEDICAAAIREVKEETGVDAEFVEVLAFRQSHQSFFRKSDLFFVCMLRPSSFHIQKQDSEIVAAQWMAAQEYAAQPFVQEHRLFNYVAKICLTKSEEDYAGFSPLSATTASGKTSYLYFNDRDCHPLTTENPSTPQS